jgi:hypothetical protein
MSVHPKHGGVFAVHAPGTLVRSLASMIPLATAAAVAVLLFSGAASANHTFVTGTLRITSRSGPTLSVAHMAIGDKRSGWVTVTNTGTLASNITLQHAVTGSTRLARHLTLAIYRDQDENNTTTVYKGPLANFTAAQLGLFAPNGGTQTFYFHVMFPSTGSNSGDNALQGLTATDKFIWTGVQAYGD